MDDNRRHSPNRRIYLLGVVSCLASMATLGCVSIKSTDKQTVTERIVLGGGLFVPAQVEYDLVTEHNKK